MESLTFDSSKHNRMQKNTNSKEKSSYEYESRKASFSSYSPFSVSKIPYAASYVRCVPSALQLHSKCSKLLLGSSCCRYLADRGGWPPHSCNLHDIKQMPVRHFLEWINFNHHEIFIMNWFGVQQRCNSYSCHAVGCTGVRKTRNSGTRMRRYVLPTFSQILPTLLDASVLAAHCLCSYVGGTVYDRLGSMCIGNYDNNTI
jgi:hypothetical protein